MPLVAAELTNIATVVSSRITHIGLHTGNPGTTGANELSSGGYARLPVTWTVANGVATSNELVFTAPASTVSYFSGWSAITSGTFRGGNAFSVAVTLTAAGQIKVILTIPVSALS